MKKILFILIMIIPLFCLPLPGHSANDLTGSTWIIDTVGPVTSSTVRFVWIYWTGITTDAHVLQISEYPSGRRIIKAQGLSGVDMGWSFPGTSGIVTGIIVQTLGSGEIQIRLGKDDK
jgi:hypothetical protein